MDNKTIKYEDVLKFEDYGDFADFIYEMALDTPDDDEIAIICNSTDVTRLIKGLFVADLEQEDCLSLQYFELESEEFDGYSGPYMLTIGAFGIYCEKILGEDGKMYTLYENNVYVTPQFYEMVKNSLYDQGMDTCLTKVYVGDEPEVNGTVTIVYDNEEDHNLRGFRLEGAKDGFCFNAELCSCENTDVNEARVMEFIDSMLDAYNTFIEYKD